MSILSGDFVANRLLCTSSAETNLGGHDFKYDRALEKFATR
jgi:hypothetical protein